MTDMMLHHYDDNVESLTFTVPTAYNQNRKVCHIWLDCMPENSIIWPIGGGQIQRSDGRYNVNNPLCVHLHFGIYIYHKRVDWKKISSMWAIKYNTYNEYRCCRHHHRRRRPILFLNSSMNFFIFFSGAWNDMKKHVASVHQLGVVYVVYIYISIRCVLLLQWNWIHEPFTWIHIDLFDQMKIKKEKTKI